MFKFLKPSFILIWGISLINPAFAAGEAPRLRFPVACNLGVDCWLMNLPDDAPEKDKAKDFTCGNRTYEGHSGTDIAIADRRSMDEGVDVIAAAAGTVTRLRDGEDDIFRNADGQAAIRKNGRECGNGLIIDHGYDWSTQYCHLKKGSFKVSQGDQIKAGQVIAQIGLSGISDHPHVHLSVRHKDQEIDPFSGLELKAGCGMPVKPLWGERVPLTSYNIYDGGFAADTPDFALISEGLKPPEPDSKAKKIIFWFAYFAAQKGDRINLTLTSPAGSILAEQQLVQEKDRARQYYFTGRRVSSSTADKGIYKGEVRITRVNKQGNTITETFRREFKLE